MLSSNNNRPATKFQLHLQVFAHATLLKADLGLKYILNIITVAVLTVRMQTDVDARRGRLRFADAYPKFHDPYISDV